MAKKFQIEEGFFDGMSEGEVKNSIINSLTQIKSVKEDLKAYSAAASDTIKELEARIEAGLHALDSLKAVAPPF